MVKKQNCKHNGGNVEYCLESIFSVHNTFQNNMLYYAQGKYKYAEYTIHYKCTGCCIMHVYVLFPDKNAFWLRTLSTLKFNGTVSSMSSQYLICIQGATLFFVLVILV